MGGASNLDQKAQLSAVPRLRGCTPGQGHGAIPAWGSEIAPTTACGQKALVGRHSPWWMMPRSASFCMSLIAVFCQMPPCVRSASQSALSRRLVRVGLEMMPLSLITFSSCSLSLGREATVTLGILTTVRPLTQAQGAVTKFKPGPQRSAIQYLYVQGFFLWSEQGPQKATPPADPQWHTEEQGPSSDNTRPPRARPPCPGSSLPRSPPGELTAATDQLRNF